jgi:LuxR family maltose regulon positive regulatory protein
VSSERDVLLATKLHVPRPRPGLVPRPRLAERLDEGLTRGLVLVCAPAGYGKTVLLADWARRGQQPAAWLSLDAGDNDPARFWRHGVAALDQVRPGLAKRVAPLLGLPAPPSYEGLVTALINELAAEPGADEALLVHDDYHVIDSGTVHESLGFLLEHRPPGLRLVLASRSDPPLALARLRARGQLTELRAAELRFTADEAAALLRHMAAGIGGALPDAAVAALAARTEGWAAGLQLAGLSLRGRNDLEGFVAAFTGSHRYVLDYLAEEVLERQPGRVREFLLETSVLERLSGELCDAVTGRPGSQALLEGLADDAIRHAVAAGEMTWAARLIERHFDTVYSLCGGAATIHRWLSALSADLIESRPRLLLAQAQLAAASGRLDAVKPLLDAAEHAAAGAAEEPFEPTIGRAASLLVSVPALKALCQAYLAQYRGDAEATAVLASRALAESGEGSRLGSIAQGFLAVAEWLLGRLAAAERAFVSSIAGFGAAGQHIEMAWSGYSLVQIQRAQGRADAAAGTCRHMLEITARPGRPPLPAAGPGYVGLAEIAYQRNELDTALRHVTEGIELCRQLAYTPPLAAGLVTLAWIRQATGDPGGALAAIGEAGQASPGPPGLLNPVPAQRARLLLAQGDLAAAARWIEERGLGADDDPDYPREPGYLVLAPGPARPGPARPGARAARPAARDGGCPGPGGQHHRGRGAARAGAGRHRRGSRRGDRPGRGSDPRLPAGLRPGLRRRGTSDGRAAGPADRSPAVRRGGCGGPARLPGPVAARL